MHFRSLIAIRKLLWKHHKAKFEKRNKIADSRFAISNQSDVEQLKENPKTQNTLKATQTWLKVWQNWAIERKVDRKIEDYELDKMLQASILSQFSVPSRGS